MPSSSDLLNPPDGGPGSALAYVLQTVQEEKSQRIARAQKMKGYLQSQGFSDAEMIANPEMRKIYMESIGMPATQAGAGPRRGPLGILPPQRQAVPAESVPVAKTASSILKNDFSGQLGEMSLPQAVDTFGQSGMSRLLNTPETDVKRTKAMKDEELNAARAAKLRKDAQGLPPEKVRDMAVKAVDADLQGDLNYSIMKLSDAAAADEYRKEKIQKTLYYYEQGKFQTSVEALNEKYGVK